MKEQDYIYVPDKAKELATNEKAFEIKEKTVYSILGRHDKIENDYPILCDSNEELAEDKIDALAKVINNKYYVKVNSRGDLCNPVGLYESAVIKTHKSKKIGKQSDYDWLEVNEKAFTLYLSFLRTKIIRYLTQAQRVIQ